MQPVMWHKKRLLAIMALSIIAYMFLRNKHYSMSKERLLPNVKAELVWEFLADFSHMKKYLIPHMRNFTINAESGNYDHWKYSVTYEEPILVWPFMNTFSVGHYSIRTEGERYIISSVHKTCMFNGWACSNSKCDFTIRQINKDALYKEEIEYDCPPLFSFWCTRVADYSRQDFITNLLNYFKYGRG